MGIRGRLRRRRRRKENKFSLGVSGAIFNTEKGEEKRESTEK